MLPSILVAARRELAARVAAAVSAHGALGVGASTKTIYHLLPTWTGGGGSGCASSAPSASEPRAFASAAAAAPPPPPPPPSLATAAAAALAELPSAAPPSPRPRGRLPVERPSLPSSETTTTPTPAATDDNAETNAPAPIRTRLKSLGLDDLAADRIAAWKSPDTGYQPALMNPEAVARRVELFVRRLGGRGASRLLGGNPNALNLQDSRLDETLQVLAEEVGRVALGELDDGDSWDSYDDDDRGGGEWWGQGGGATTPTTTKKTTAAEDAARVLLLRNHYLIAHARGTLRDRARAALSAVRRVPGCASPPSRAARVLLAQPRLLSSARLAARCEFLAALEATDPHRPAMARRWSSLSPGTLALVLSHRSAALLRLLYLQRAPLRATAALGGPITSAVTAAADDFVAEHPGWAAWERALARLPQADVDRCLRELRPPPTLAEGGKAGEAAAVAGRGRSRGGGGGGGGGRRAKAGGG